MRRVARNPEVVIVANPAIPFPLFRERTKMAKRRRRKHRANRGRKAHRRVAYNRKARSRKAHSRKGRKSRKSHKARKGRKRCVGGYASFTRSMWKKHRAAYKRLGIKRAAKAIARAWKKK